MDSLQGNPVYLGDELGATGYRLAGAESFVISSDDELEARLASALAHAPLVLLGAAVAQRLPAERLQSLLRGTRPLVTVVPDFSSRALPPDLSGWLRGQLGMNP
jgi:vacuolar-type H+-ATPase subunit F/Vma7